MEYSRLGFGCYRVHYKVDEHINALKKALLSGINVIDTSSNYSDGGSEILIGNVLDDLFTEDKLQREDINLITKVGYIQGHNYTFAEHKKKSGEAFEEVVEYADKLWHCINPEFIEDQLTKQLTRLNQEYLDGYLLHNPEYYLGYAEKEGMEKAEAREEYYKRIKKAFEFLDKKVSEGIIKSYGISSNTFGSAENDYNFTSLFEISKFANDNFKIIQFPLNLVEINPLLNKNNNGKTVLEFAKELNLKVLINRPLNAITSKGLIRLAEFNFVTYTEKDFYKQLEKLKLMEDDMISEKLATYSIDENELKRLKKIFSFGKILDENWKYFGSIEHFNDNVEHHFIPKIDYLIEYFELHFQNEDTLNYLKKFLNELYLMLNLISNHYKMKASKRTNFFNAKLNELTGDSIKDLTLSQKALLLLNSIDGISTILVGARRERYIDDIIKINQLPNLGNSFEVLLNLHNELIQAENL
ncbi:MAG TPA: aldo/keto reductase [Ignavibacteria bacterium]|nr:aldo/keto reductase [Ignavibacteria bacterium]